MQQNFKWNKLELGTCYYPEHWDEALWEEDLCRMKEVGIYTIRIAEFAWSKFEPTEGEFTFSFFDAFMKVVEKCDMKVIFGTPTATPPAWLTNKYPEVLNATIDGVLYRHGARRHYNYNSIVYQKFCARIVEKIAQHYGNHPNIVGWQIDNEINCETAEFYSDSDTLAFREYLKDTYKTLEALNTAWGAVFWNQTYTSWDEIYVPRTTLNDSTNPHEVLDYKRFVSYCAIRFCRMQSDILRKYIRKGAFITTNGMFGNLDNHKMEKECLDVYTYDSYPNFAYCLIEDPKHSKDLNDRKWSSKLTEVRSVCPHFGIMEQQSGANGWNTRMEAPAPKPGQMMLWTMQSIAHGADYVSFFRWRTCHIGTEIYWHGILDYDNLDNRKLAEVSKINDRVQKLADITNAAYFAEVGVVKDYDNIWDSELDRWHGRFDKPSYLEIFAGAQLSHTPFDYYYIQEDSTVEEMLHYKVLFYPHPLMLSAHKVELLTAYVEQGGTLIVGCRTGLKDEHGHCPMSQMPGLLSPLTGVGVKDFTFIGPNDDPVSASWDGKTMETPVFNDILEVKEKDVTVLATYTGTYYAGEAALTERKVGRGRILYLGSTFTRETVVEMLTYLEAVSPYKHVISLPEDCELAVRRKDDKEYIFVLNYGHSESQIKLLKEMTDIDTGEKVRGQVTLKPYETKVYMKK